MKPRRIKRSKFETSGFRSITLSYGDVVFPDGRNCRFNVRLMADQGSEGGIRLIVEDINKNGSYVKSIKLRRAI